MVIRLLLHIDGLLQRFGRVVPDAIALLGSVDRLRARLGRGPWPVAIEPVAVRFADGTESLSTVLDELGLGPFDLPTETRAAVDALAPPGDDESLVLLSGNRRVYEEAWALGLDAYLVGLEPAEPSRGLAFGDIPRILEEKLRLPTARPMSNVARTGGLLAVTCADTAEARAQALEAMQADAQADWVILGNVLILYTEEPDYEDHLVSRANVERLSYGVQKHRLRVERRTKGEGLFVGQGFVLLEGEVPANDNGSPWTSVRHRCLSAAREPARRAPVQSLWSGPELQAARDAVESRRRRSSLSHWSAIGELLPPSACFDTLEERGETVAVAWQTAGPRSAGDELDMIVHTLPNKGRLDRACHALALAQRLRDVGWSDSVHCLRPRDISVERLSKSFLFHQERARARITELD